LGRKANKATMKNMLRSALQKTAVNLELLATVNNCQQKPKVFETNYQVEPNLT
jgi:hypothetical protein